MNNKNYNKALIHYDIIKHKLDITQIFVSRIAKPIYREEMYMKIDMFKGLIVKHLSECDNIDREENEFLIFIKEISPLIIRLGNSNLFAIAIISWFTFKDYNKEKELSKLEYMREKLEVIKKGYDDLRIGDPLVVSRERTFNYKNSLNGLLVSDKFGYGSYKDMCLPMVLNQTMSIRYKGNRNAR